LRIRPVFNFTNILKLASKMLLFDLKTKANAWGHGVAITLKDDDMNVKDKKSEDGASNGNLLSTPQPVLGFELPDLPPVPTKIVEPRVNEDIPDGSLRDDQEFFIPIHDFVRFTEDEIKVIDHPAFQRLGKVYQLGQAYLVYRGATHKRMEHVLGTVWVAQKIANALRASYDRSLRKGLQQRTKCKFDSPLSPLEVRFVRLAALLHDIGHLPAGHTLEDELGLLPSHDGDLRLGLVFDKEDWIDGVKSPRLGELIDDTYKKYLSPGTAITPRMILQKLISKDAVNITSNFEGIRVNVCRDIVGNTICADLLDYLHRDWYHIGKPRFFDKRLFEYMEIRCDATKQIPQLVISYGQRSRPKRDAISSILELLESRYNLGEAVLFHPTKCAAAAMLERAIAELHAVVPVAEQDQWLAGLVNRLLAWSDEQMIQSFLSECQERRCQPGLLLLQNLASRNIYKSVDVVYMDELSVAQTEKIQHHYLNPPDDLRNEGMPATPDGKLDDKRKAAQKRMLALRLLEADFRLDAGSMVMYCPSQSMNSKLAQVKIIFNEAIQTLDVWDKGRDRLAGGHCAAQLERFARLWRVEVFMREADLRVMQPRNAQRETEYLHLFKRRVRSAVLGVTLDGKLTEEEAFEIAEGLSRLDGGPYKGYKAFDMKAARGRNENDFYPLGAPLLRTLLRPNES
jgi:HD superfamily phosphohydrolase